MKRIIAACLLCFLLVSCSSGKNEQNAGETTAPSDGVVYEYSKGGSNRKTAAVTYENGVEVSRDNYDYWTSGEIKTVTTIQNGVTVQTWNYMYNDGRLYQSAREFTDGGVACKELYTYNENTNPTIVEFYENGEKSGSIRYSYNENNKPNLEEKLDLEGGVLSYKKYEYDDAQRNTKTSYYEFDSLIKYWEYTYDANGNNTEVIEYNRHGEVTNRTHNSFDESGNLLSSETEKAE